MRTVSLKQQQEQQVRPTGIQVVLIPNVPRLNGHAILRKGLAAIFAAKARQQGVDLEAIVSATEPTLLPPLEAEVLGAPGGLLFVPAVSLPGGEVDWAAVQAAVQAAGGQPLVPYWDEESRINAELTGGIPVYSSAEAWRSSGLTLEAPWGEAATFITVHPKVRVLHQVAEAFVASIPGDLVTLARVSNLPFVQAAKAAGKRVFVIDPGLLDAWREETRALLEGAEVVRTANAYGPGEVARAVRWSIAHTSKAFGIEPPGLRSEAGLAPVNIWDRVKALSQVRQGELV